MNYKKNCIATFFISLFLLNGAYSVIPKLFSCNTPALEKVYGVDPENENEKGGERAGKEVKDIYLDNSLLPHPFAMNPHAREKMVIPDDIHYRKHIHISTPTPPPESL